MKTHSLAAASQGIKILVGDLISYYKQVATFYKQKLECRAHTSHSGYTTEFTRFTSTKVQILTFRRVTQLTSDMTYRNGIMRFNKEGIEKSRMLRSEHVCICS